ncbi:GDSL-type esterase/lipase family protein [Lachnospiraceae bacterium 62-35]
MKKTFSWKKAAVIGLSTAMLLGTTGTSAFAGNTNMAASVEVKTVAGATIKAMSIAYETKTVNRETSAKTEDAAEGQEREIGESEIDSYFKDSVIVGDSIMLGYRNYCMKSNDPFLRSLSFLASGSFSVHNALWPVNDKSVHPIYQGAQRPVWESISMMGAKKVFMFFGLNDLNMGDDTCELYQQVIGNIKELSPDAEIHVIAMTYTLKGKGKGKLNNNNIRAFNVQLKGLAEENGWGFIDMATPLSDANGDLAAEYCSDDYVHQSRAAYQVWTNVLRQYAKDQLKDLSAS